MSKNANNEFKKLPGVLAFQRGLVITDAAFWNIQGDGTLLPVNVVRHGIRGTQNINKEGKRDVSNIQMTDTAKLAEDAAGLAVTFSLRFLDLENVLFACAKSKDAKDDEDLAGFRKSVDEFILRAKNSDGLNDVSRRIARNILNGRWLWRNRTIAQSVRVRVTRKMLDGPQTVGEADALKIPTSRFSDYLDAEEQVAAVIADGLHGNVDTTLFVRADLDFGVRGAVEVFPSQNYVENKPDGFARPLYCLNPVAMTHLPDDDRTGFESTRVMGQAAFRDQKISNALRTIDTWYPRFAEYGRPIAVEPLGASIEAQEFFRSRKESAFDMARRLNTMSADSDEGMFMIASLIRGGVYSGG
jgi:CRISPR-associated protein Csy3